MFKKQEVDQVRVPSEGTKERSVRERDVVSTNDLVFPKQKKEDALKGREGEKLEKLVEDLGNARYLRGLYLHEGMKAGGDPSSVMGLSLANERIKHLEKGLEKALLGAGSGKYEEILNAVGQRELEGIREATEKREAGAREEAGRKEAERKAGGASYAIREILKKAKDSFKSIVPTTQESAEMVGKTIASEVSTFAQTGSLEEAKLAGGETLNQIRQKNLETRGESVLGTNEEFSKGSNSVVGNAVSAAGILLSPLEKTAGASITPALESVDVGLRASRAASYNMFAGKDGQVSYSDYQELEKQEVLLKGAKLSMDASKIAIGAAALGPSSLTQLAQPALVSGGMGYASALSQELLSEEGFKLGRFLEQGFVGTADSMMFMGGIKGVTYLAEKTGALHGMSSLKTFASLESGVEKERKLAAIYKSYKGMALTTDEARFITNISNEMRMSISGTIDLVDAYPDLKHSLETFSQTLGEHSLEEVAKKLATDPEYGRKLSGAILGVGVAAYDTFDVSQGAKHLIQEEYQGRSKKLNYEEDQKILEKAYQDRQYQAIHKRLISEGVSAEEANTIALIESKKQAEGIKGYYDRENDRAHVALPETLKRKGVERDTRIIESSYVVHELAHQKLERSAKVQGIDVSKDPALQIEQEVKATLEQAAYLAARGFEMYVSDESGKIEIRRVISEEDIRSVEQPKTYGCTEEQVRRYQAFVKDATSLTTSLALTRHIEQTYQDRDNSVLAAARSGEQREVLGEDPFIVSENHDHEIITDPVRIVREESKKFFEELFRDVLEQRGMAGGALERILGLESQDSLHKFEAYLHSAVKDDIFIETRRYTDLTRTTSKEFFNALIEFIQEKSLEGTYDQKIAKKFESLLYQSAFGYSPGIAAATYLSDRIMLYGKFLLLEHAPLAVIGELIGETTYNLSFADGYAPVLLDHILEYSNEEQLDFLRGLESVSRDALNNETWASGALQLIDEVLLGLSEKGLNPIVCYRAQVLREEVLASRRSDNVFVGNQRSGNGHVFQISNDAALVLNNTGYGYAIIPHADAQSIVEAQRDISKKQKILDDLKSIDSEKKLFRLPNNVIAEVLRYAIGLEHEGLLNSDLIDLGKKYDSYLVILEEVQQNDQKRRIDEAKLASKRFNIKIEEFISTVPENSPINRYIQKYFDAKKAGFEEAQFDQAMAIVQQLRMMRDFRNDVYLLYPGADTCILASDVLKKTHQKIWAEPEPEEILSHKREMKVVWKRMMNIIFAEKDTILEYMKQELSKNALETPIPKNISLTELTSDPRYCPFDMKTAHLIPGLLSCMYDSGLRKLIESDMKVDLRKMPFRSQIHLFNYLINTTTIEYQQLKELCNSLHEDQTREVFFKAFFGVCENQDTVFKLIDLMKNLDEKTSYCIISKYSEILDYVHRVDLEVASILGLDVTLDQIRSISQKIVLQANRILTSKYKEFQKVGFDSGLVLEMIQDLHSVRAEAVLWLGAFQTMKESENASLTLEDLKNIEILKAIPGKEIPEAYKQQMRDISHDNTYSLYPLPAREPVYLKLVEALESTKSKFYVLAKDGVVLQFLKFVDVGDHYELGSVNARSEIKGMKGGVDFISKLVAQYGALKPIVLEAWEGTPARELYKKLGFIKIGVDENYLGSGIPFDVYRREVSE